ncbi:MAG TPA: hypothetical protein VEF36_01330 [Roseiarcus sp.]|nr:hypothetical protein [Roseiarcus sp.]
MNLVSLTMIRPAEAYNDDGEPIEITQPVKVNAAHVRSFNPRRHDKPGTRITFANGRGFAVVESMATVAALLGEASAAPLALTHQG